ncbi:MAG: hypothetical protein JW776_05810 [Candidatus Lokiarchaeota archaeon]|nr:hypothetical protein [Candidatus Lokiarchaeota archaeon]
MKKLRTTLIFLTLVIISTWIIGSTTFSSATTYSDEYQQLLEYQVTDWNETNGVEWYIWDFTNPIHRGFAGTQKGGRITVNITSTHNKSSQLSYLANPDPVPYGDINFYMRNGFLNFTETNISITEMAYILNLGYMNWFPGFMIPNDWEENGAFALAQRNVFSILCEVTITNNTNSVVYDFKQQTGTILQNTTLEYDLTSGALVRAYTEFGNYWCEIALQNFQIPGFSLSLLSVIAMFTIIGISLFVRKNHYKK